MRHLGNHKCNTGFQNALVLKMKKSPITNECAFASTKSPRNHINTHRTEMDVEDTKLKE